MKIKRWTAVTLATVGAAGLGVALAGTNLQRRTAVPTTTQAPIADMLAARSPGARGAAAVSDKVPVVHQAHFTPTYAPSALAEREPAEGPKLAMAAPVAVSPVASAPISAAPAVLAPSPVPPTAIAAAGTPVAVIPAAAAVGGGTGLGAAALLPVIPVAFAAASSGGGGGGSAVDLAPAIPEPSTWMMMITGFGVLGFALRRRRRRERHNGADASLGLALAKR